jgi:hypothetical protein
MAPQSRARADFSACFERDNNRSSEISHKRIEYWRGKVPREELEKAEYPFFPNPYPPSGKAARGISRYRDAQNGAGACFAAAFSAAFE